MMKKHISILLLVFILSSSFSQDIPPNIDTLREYPTGCIIDPEIYKLESKFIATVTRGELPSSYSLKRFAPVPKDQVGPTCTGWATSYAAFTIIKRIETGKFIEPYSPRYVFNRTQTIRNIDPCYKQGSHVHIALNVLKDQGAPYKHKYPSECKEEEKNMFSDKLISWKTLPIEVKELKAALCSNEPIVISMRTYNKAKESSLSYKHVNQFGYWSYDHKNKDKELSGHAMCVVGYDDNMFGGAFEVINSWGTDWGNRGYFWLKYSDLEKYISAARSLVPRKIASDYTSYEKQLKNETKENIHFKNKTLRRLRIAVAYEDVNGNHSQGWYSINPLGKAEIEISLRASSIIYWTATTKSSLFRSTWSARSEVDIEKGRYKNRGKEFYYDPYFNFSYNEKASGKKKLFNAEYIPSSWNYIRIYRWEKD
jgi:hypothetical protein